MTRQSIRNIAHNSSTLLSAGALAFSLFTLALPSTAIAANISGVSATPNPFSAGSSTSINYTLGQGALTWLRIYDQSNIQQRALLTPSDSTPNGNAGSNNTPWDGRNGSGSALPIGSYNYTIDNAFYFAHYSLGQVNPHDIAVNPANPTIIWATAKTSPYVYKSTNGGSSWQGVSTGANAKDYGIAISNDGQRIFIANDGQSRLFVSTNGGGSWGVSGSFPNNSTKIADVASNTSGTVLYVLDYGNRRLFKSSNGGSSWSVCAASGMSLTDSARGVGTDPSGNTVIVADTSGDRLFKSTNGCASFSQISAISSGTGAGQVQGPYQIEIQADGKFWVSERVTHRIQQFDANGNSLMTFGGPSAGSGNYQFNSANFYFGIELATIGAQNYIFVSDYDNMRIKRVGYDNWVSTTPLQIGTGGGGGSGGNLTTAGVSSASASGNSAIAVNMPYSGDQNANNTYKVEYKLSSAGTWDVFTASAAHVISPYTATITELSSGASYDVRMTFNDADGVSGANPQTVSNIVLSSGTCDAQPKQPTTLKVTDTPADDGESLDLSWIPSASGCVVEQRIYRKDDTTSSEFVLWEILPGNSATSYRDVFMEKNKTYSYRIRAYNGSQESNDSPTAGATVVDDLPPSAPTAVTATAGNGKVFLSWAPSTSWDAYEQRIYRSTNGGSSYSLLIDINGLDFDYIDTTASNGTTYHYQIAAYDGAWEVKSSASNAASPASNRVDPPTRLSAAAGDAKVQLMWTPSTSGGITQQRIYRSTGSGGGYVLAGTLSGTATSLIDTGLSNGATYFYVIRAFNGTAESGNSNETKASPVANLSPVAHNGNLSVLKDSAANGVLSAADESNAPLTYTLISKGINGTATLTNSNTGTYRYMPKAGATGTDTLTFKVNDGNSDSNVATISVTIGTALASVTLNSGWNLVSIPTALSPTNNLNSLLLDDLGTNPEVYTWPSYGIAGTFEGYYLPATTATPGRAYWLVLDKDGTVIDDQFNGANTTQCDPALFPGVQCVNVALSPGGNLIGNPYQTVKNLLLPAQAKVCNSTKTNGCKNAADWKSFTEAVSSGWLLNALYSYNPATQSYEYVQSIADGAINLAPWEGWWLRVETKDAITLRFFK